MSHEQLSSLLKDYADMLCVLRSTKLRNRKFGELRNFLSDYCDEKNIQQCLTISDVIDLLKEKLRIYPFNIDALNVSCKRFCNSKVETSLEQYRQQLSNFLSNTSVKDLQESLKTKLVHGSTEFETVSLKLDDCWMENTLKHLKHLAHHLVGNYTKALIPMEASPGCVCVTWIVPTSIACNLREKAEQLSLEYLASRGVIEFVIGLRLSPNEGLCIH